MMIINRGIKDDDFVFVNNPFVSDTYFKVVHISGDFALFRSILLSIKMSLLTH